MNGEELLILNEKNPAIMARLDATGRRVMWAKGITGKNVKVGNIGNTRGLKGDKHEIIHKSYINNPITGQAPDCMVKDYDCGAETYLHEIADAIIQGVKDGMHFMSVAYSHYSPHKPLEDAINYAWENNCMVTSTVGNDGDESKRFPAAYEKCVGIGSIDNQHLPSDFSVYGSRMIATYYGEHTPGFDGKDYSMQIGTSFAEPVVSGVLVLILDEILAQGKPHPGCQALLNMLIDNCIDLGEIGYDKYTGYGMPTLDRRSFFDCHLLLHDNNRDGLSDRVNEIIVYYNENKHTGISIDDAQRIVSKNYHITTITDGIPLYGGRKQ